MSTFEQLKKNRLNNLQEITKKLDNLGGKPSGDTSQDFWKLTVDKETGIGSAVIRFMPAPKNEEFPFVTRFSYFLHDKERKKVYSNLSLETLGQKDPVAEANRQIYFETKKNKYSRSERKIVNILVVSDPGNPENEGKVFKYEAPKQVFGLIQSKIKPIYAGEKAFNPFCFWEGANFLIRSRFGENNFTTYADSTFDKQSALFDGDDTDLQELYDALFSLEEEISPEKFKTYEQLKTEFDNFNNGSSKQQPKKEEEFKELERERKNYNRREQTAPPRRETPAPIQRQQDPFSMDDDDEFDLSSYQKYLD